MTSSPELSTRLSGPLADLDPTTLLVASGVVVETHGLRAVVLYVTSTDKSGRPGWLAVPRQGWSPRVGTSWLRTDRRIVLDAYRFRRYAGACPPSVRKALGI